MNKFAYIILIFFLFQEISRAEFIFAGDIVSYQKFDDRVEFILTNAKFNLYVVSDNIIRFRFTNQNEFSEAPSYAVVYKFAPHNFIFNESEDHFEISTAELIINISRSPCRVTIFDSDRNIINEDEKSFGVSFDQDEVRCFKALFDGEQFYGLGEKTGNLAKRGSQFTMWNSDTPGYTWNQDPIYQSIPFFIGVRNKKAYGIFFDNTFKSWFNMGASNNRFYWFGAQKGEMDYYFIYGPEIKKVVSSYTLLTGRMEMPPKWALGYQQSKWSYYPESTVRNLAKEFRDRNIPCDVIYLDIHYMRDYRVFTWNEERFPEPEKMLKDLNADGFKLIPIVDPAVKADTLNYAAANEGLQQDLFAKYPDGVVFKGEVWPSWSYFPDFTKKETREWWGEKNANLIEQGFAGIWNDMNEPAIWGQSFPDIVQFDDNGFGANHKKIHNVYALEMAHATFEGLKKAFPNKRPFILTRAGFAGIQRYAAVWTGDNVANEDHLKMACIMPQGMGLSGIAFCGSDVGGFFESPSQRLYTRWMQLGAFTPFYRGHTIINTKDQEPWAFGEEVERWVRDVLNLRYQLLPFLYNEFYNTSQTGIPIMRPVFLNFQDDGECYTQEAQYQFMVGEDLLVAPVLSEHDNFKKLYLPEGKWLDWWTNKIYEGKQWIIVEAPIWRIPLFIKEGGIIPMQESQNYVGEKKIDRLELRIFPSANSKLTLFEDDGSSMNYAEGNYSLTYIEIQKNNNEYLVNISKTKNNFSSGRKTYFVKLYNTDNVTSVSVNDRSLSLAVSSEKLGELNEGFYFNEEDKVLNIKVMDEENLKIVYKLK